MDIHSMLVWVIAGNPARRFYEALGGEKVYEKEIECGGAMLVEEAYGWTDTSLTTLMHPLRLSGFGEDSDDTAPTA